MRDTLALASLVLLAGCIASEPPPPPRPAPKPVAKAPVVRRVPVPAPKPKPAWTMRKVVPDAVDVPAGQVTVAAGDTLARIAAARKASVGAIAAANNLVPPYLITPGQVLSVPGGRYHRVKPGETGITIARAYSAEWSKVIAANRLQAPYVLRVGEVLLLPSRDAVAAMTLEERARAFKLDIDDLITGSEPARGEHAAAVPEPKAFADRFVWPLEGRLLSRFGAKPGGRYNDGINVKATAGTPIRAAADGVVAYAGDAIEGFGGLVLLKHGDGWVTAYAHAEALLVARGDKVTKGDIIARAGATGSVDEPQLHFEIRRGRTPVDPLLYLPQRSGGA